jgi:hypothetical protein
MKAVQEALDDDGGLFEGKSAQFAAEITGAMINAYLASSRASLFSAAAAARRDLRSLLTPCALARTQAFLCSHLAAPSSSSNSSAQSVASESQPQISGNLYRQASCASQKSPRVLSACAVGTSSASSSFHSPPPTI